MSNRPLAQATFSTEVSKLIINSIDDFSKYENVLHFSYSKFFSKSIVKCKTHEINSTSDEVIYDHHDSEEDLFAHLAEKNADFEIDDVHLPTRATPVFIDDPNFDFDESYEEDEFK